MQLLGRPYFSALTNHTPYDRLDGVAASHLEQVTKAITHPSQWGRRAAKLTSEQPTPAWKALQNVHTAQSVASALPRNGEGHALTQDEWVRLKADGVLSVAELKSVLGDGADVVAMIADVGYTGRTATISNEQLATLQTRLGELRAGHLVEVRSAMDHLSVVPEAGAAEVIAEAIAELTQTGSRLHNYFMRPPGQGARPGQRPDPAGPSPGTHRSSGPAPDRVPRPGPGREQPAGDTSLADRLGPGRRLRRRRERALREPGAPFRRHVQQVHADVQPFAEPRRQSADHREPAAEHNRGRERERRRERERGRGRGRGRHCRHRRRQQQ